MTRLATSLLPLFVFLTGCYANVQAPGATGKVFDAATGMAVRGAIITRPALVGGLGAPIGVGSEGLPAVTTISTNGGSFDLPPALKTEFFIYSRNPPKISGSFIITADGYATNELHGFATSSSRWRVELGQVLLKKQ